MIFLDRLKINISNKSIVLFLDQTLEDVLTNNIPLLEAIKNVKNKLGITSSSSQKPVVSGNGDIVDIILNHTLMGTDFDLHERYRLYNNEGKGNCMYLAFAREYIRQIQAGKINDIPQEFLEQLKIKVRDWRDLKLEEIPQKITEMDINGHNFGTERSERGFAHALRLFEAHNIDKYVSHFPNINNNGQFVQTLRIYSNFRGENTKDGKYKCL